MQQTSCVGCDDLLDYLVGESEELGRKLDAERLRGLEIDHQLELGRLLHRQLGR